MLTIMEVRTLSTRLRSRIPRHVNHPGVRSVLRFSERDTDGKQVNIPVLMHCCDASDAAMTLVCHCTVLR